jgi:hypothetical protein
METRNEIMCGLVHLVHNLGTADFILMKRSSNATFEFVTVLYNQELLG